MFFLMSSIFCRFSLHRKADEKQMCAVRPISMYLDKYILMPRGKKETTQDDDYIVIFDCIETNNIEQ